MSSSSELLAADCVSRTFPIPGRRRERRLVHAVRDVDLAIARGSAVGLVGESGSGKTTLARMLIGLETPTAGRVLLRGEPVGRRWVRASEVQMVFQDPYTSLDPRQSAVDMLDEVQRVRFDRTAAERGRRTAELLEAVGLGRQEAEALPGALSGGQRQRAAIARALAVEPELLILDEAVSALDVSVQGQIVNLLNDLRSELSLTYLLISHDLAVVRQMVDTVVVMYRGRVVEQGPIDAVLDRPQHPYTRRLRAAVPEAGKALGGRTAPAEPRDAGCVFHHRCELAGADCDREPALAPAGPNHLARCWRTQEEPAPAEHRPTRSHTT